MDEFGIGFRLKGREDSSRKRTSYYLCCLDPEFNGNFDFIQGDFRVAPMRNTLEVYSGWANLDKKQGGFKNIMSSVRKHYSTDLKVKIVLEILKEEKSVTQLASDHKIHYSQLLKWKKQVMEGLPDLFSDSRTEALKTTHEKEVMALYQEIGQLTTQLAWLKKKSGIA